MFAIKSLVQQHSKLLVGPLKSVSTQNVEFTGFRPLSLIVSRNLVQFQGVNAAVGFCTLSSRIASVHTITGVSVRGLKTKSGPQKVKSHAGIKKRFKANANGLLKFRGSGREHRMRKNTRDKNRAKGATSYLRPGSSANLYTRYCRAIIGLKPAKPTAPKRPNGYQLALIDHLKSVERRLSKQA